MIKIVTILALLSHFCLAEKKIDNSFITKFEYGAMLYQNPRGIGCSKCHGDDARGSFIALYKDDKSNVHKVTAPNISDISEKKFYTILQSKKSKSKIMPTYFLTVDELDSIYFYIKNLEKQ